MKYLSIIKCISFLAIVGSLVNVSCTTNKNLNGDGQSLLDDSDEKNLLSKTDSIVEIKQEFINKKGDYYISETHYLNLSVGSFALLSAYTLDTETTSNFYYTVKSDTTWNDWIKVSPNHNINPDRTVYGGTNVFTDIIEIKFKMDQVIEQPLIVRIFKPN